ncbi:MAG: cell division protein FtsZ [Muribaculaceae bacterium]
MAPEDIQQNHEFSTSPNAGHTYSPDKIKVIGVGGGGNNAINHMYNLGVRNVSFIVANTDRQALLNSPVPTKQLLGPNVLRGRGAGNDPERARLAAEESAAEINELFDDDTDMVFITAGMGGGTGTGASPVIARIARSRDILTIGIVTIPFLFEGPKKILKALNGAKELAKNVDALLVINNERLSEIYRDYDFLNAFGKADDILSMAAMSISEIVTTDGYINLDFNDVDNTLRNGGTAIISTGYGEGENRVTKAIEDALHSPLLRNTDIFGSKKLLFNLYFSRDAQDKFKIDETDQITQFVSNIDPDVDVIWGVSFDETLGDKVKFTILASGFDITISDDQASGGKLKAKEKADPAPGPSLNADDSAHDALVENYGADKIENMTRAKTEQRYIILQPDQLDDDSVLDVLEHNPAFNRDRAIVSSVKNAGAAQPQSKDKPEQTPGGTIDFSDLDS